MEKTSALYFQASRQRTSGQTDIPTHFLIYESALLYQKINYELLLGDYTEIEKWIADERVDCGFLRLPSHPEFEPYFRKQDRLLAILLESHPLAPPKKSR